jgi:hypothetical protein
MHQDILSLFVRGNYISIWNWIQGIMNQGTGHITKEKKSVAEFIIDQQNITT